MKLAFIEENGIEAVMALPVLDDRGWLDHFGFQADPA
jgi:hypothetical protein